MFLMSCEDNRPVGSPGLGIFYRRGIPFFNICKRKNPLLGLLGLGDVEVAHAEVDQGLAGLDDADGDRTCAGRGSPLDLDCCHFFSSLVA